MTLRAAFKSPLLLCTTLLVVTLAGGCGGGDSASLPTGYVTGTVTFQGQPVTDGSVNVLSNESGRVYTSTLGAEGKFKISESVVIGKYAFFITPPAGAAPTLDKPVVAPIDPPNIPKKYRADATSGLTEEVKEGNNDFKFDMKA
ncbi:MAG: hypothetical protein JWN70_291 [Planctomycetaceae bacterium]|nr:hypothetical protein [Planctomycetaceae bacterium]